MRARVDVKPLLPAWEQFRRATDIAPIRGEHHLHQMSDLLEALLQEAGSDPNHPALELVEIVGDLIQDYEASHPSMPTATGLDALNFLMEQHGLRQADLPEIGSQGVVSEILSGRRELNLRQVRALAERFGVSPATFV
ncbi:MAG: type II toxin-antitoxin system HigA family antitoxin [Burkholderiaceae bacterium]